MSSKTLKGFSGIIHLVSNIDKDIDAIKELCLQSPTTTPSLAQNDSDKTIPTNKQKAVVTHEKSSNTGIIIGTIAAAFIIIFIVYSNDNPSRQRPTKPQLQVSEKTTNPSLSTSDSSPNERGSGNYEDSLIGQMTRNSGLTTKNTPSDDKQEKNKASGIEYTEPPIGTGKILSVSMIRWCLREEIRLNHFRVAATLNNEVAIFNRYVENYNNRCGNYRYREGDLAAARRDVAKEKFTILENASKEVHEWANLRKQPEVSQQRKQVSPKLISTAQSLLQKLGYAPGIADGIVGSRTTKAVKLFQQIMGLDITGEIDATLIEILEQEYEKKNNKSHNSSKKKLTYITIGSHKDDVIRIQGTPSSMNSFGNNTIWNYNYSSITMVNELVVTWSNISKNLKVKIIPGANVSKLKYITIGSHKDDVIRIQGTPNSMNSFGDRDTWDYGYSTITMSNDIVVNWSNISSNLRVKIIPGENVTKSKYITIGSHKDDVIRIQGTPSAMNSFGNTENLTYGYSIVTLKNDKVANWSNIGNNLKVRITK